MNLNAAFFLLGVIMKSTHFQIQIKVLYYSKQFSIGRECIHINIYVVVHALCTTTTNSHTDKILWPKNNDYFNFTIPKRQLFRFCWIPFGLHNAPATQQPLIDKELGPGFFVYFDDIIIVFPRLEENCYIFKQKLNRLVLAKANLRLTNKYQLYC